MLQYHIVDRDLRYNNDKLKFSYLKLIKEKRRIPHYPINHNKYEFNQCCSLVLRNSFGK